MANINIDQAYINDVSNHADSDLRQPLQLYNNVYTLTEDVSSLFAGAIMLRSGASFAAPAELDGGGFTWTTCTDPTMFTDITNNDFETDAVGATSITGWTVPAGSEIYANGRTSRTWPYCHGDKCLGVPVTVGVPVTMRTTAAVTPETGWRYRMTSYQQRGAGETQTTYRIIDSADGTTVLKEVTFSGLLSNQKMSQMNWDATGESVFIEVEFEELKGDRVTYIDNVKLEVEGGFGVYIGTVPHWSGSTVTPKIYNLTANQPTGAYFRRLENLTIVPQNASYYGHAINCYRGNYPFISADRRPYIDNVTATARGGMSQCFPAVRSLGFTLTNSTLSMEPETFISNRSAYHACVHSTEAYAGRVEITGNILQECPHAGIFMTTANNFNVDGNTIRLRTRSTDGYGISLLHTNPTSQDNGIINNNTIDCVTNGDSGRGIMLDVLSSTSITNVKITNNTVDVQELPNVEHGWSALEPPALRVRKFGSGNEFENVLIDGNTFTARTDSNHCRHASGGTFNGVESGAEISHVTVTNNTFRGFWIGTGSNSLEGATGIFVNNWDELGKLILDNNIIESNAFGVTVMNGPDGGTNQPGTSVVVIDKVFGGLNTLRKRIADGSIPNSSAVITGSKPIRLGWTTAGQNIPVEQVVFVANTTENGWTDRDVWFSSSLDLPTKGRQLGFGDAVVDVTLFESDGTTPVVGGVVTMTDSEATVYTATTDALGVARLYTPEEFYRQDGTGPATFSTVSVNDYSIAADEANWTWTTLNNQTINDSHTGYDGPTKIISISMTATGGTPTNQAPVVSIAQ